MTAQTTQPASLPWLEKLIAIPTISGTSNLELIELIEAEFSRYGYSGVRTYNEDGTRANLLVTVPAADGTTRGGLILSGHTDVVPVAGQAWDADPFTLRAEGTRAYSSPVTRTSYPSPVRTGTPTPSLCVWRVPAPTVAACAT